MTFAFDLVRFNGTVLGGIRSPSYQRREKRAPIGTDGTLHQTGNGVIRAAPMASFGTIAVRTLAGILDGSTDAPMKAMNGSTGLELIGAALNTAAPGYSASSIHASRLAASGQLCLSGMSWSPGDVLEAQCDGYAIAAAGGTDPFVASSIALPTLPTNQEQLVLSSLIIGGLTILRASSWNLSIAHHCENQDESCYNTGLPFPIQLMQAGVGGQTEFRMEADILDLTGSITSSGTAVAVFTQINHLGVGLDTETLTVTLANCLIREEGISGRPGGRKIIADATFNGSTKPLTLAAA